MVRVRIVVMEKNKRDGGEDERFVAVVMMFVEGGEFVAGIVTRMFTEVVAGGVTREESLGP